MSDDRQARLAALFDAHYPLVRGYAVRRTTPADGDDITAEVFLLAWTKLHAITPGKERPWLLGCARNIVRERVRADARRQHRETAAASGQALSTDPSDRWASDLSVLEVLARLPENDRELLTLLAWEDLPLSEAAAVLGITAATARVRLFRARRRFRDAEHGTATQPQPELAEEGTA